MNIWKLLVGLGVIIISCKETTIYAPVGQPTENQPSELQISIEHNKKRNAEERTFIENWIQKNPNQKFYSTPMGYWSDIDLYSRKPNQNVAYTYKFDIYDFNNTLIYEEAILRENILPVQVEEIKAVENAIHYLNENESTTLLVPSSLGYGVSGDGRNIRDNLPLIIKLTKIKEHH